jgi:hypothetical protein
VFVLAGWSQASPGQPFVLARPDFLRGPAVSRAASAVTYSYLGTPQWRAARLQLTLAEVPASVPGADASDCASAFLKTLESQHPGFMALRDAVPLQAAGLSFDAWRWTARHGAETLTGVVACRRDGTRFFAITFQDSLHSAPETFTTIRSRLDRLEFR